ncbi:MAG: type II secretion system protein [Phycisphaeraceae bacterium]|nr:type II secretion system protein [Phycisphaeraceae bacterium]
MGFAIYNLRFANESAVGAIVARNSKLDGRNSGTAAQTRNSKLGFTLIELLVVISIIGLLLGLLMPALASARRTGRQSVCLSNLHQLAAAQTQYLAENNETFWPYFQTETTGRRWWFGFELNGPGSGTNRPLDKSKAVLAYYLTTDDDVFNCPSFPYDEAGYFPKFERRAASYGYNLHLATGPRRIVDYAGRASEVFVFADAIHFDFGVNYNEGHYILYNRVPVRSGYAHYRHDDTTSVLFMDGHAQSRRERGLVFNTTNMQCAGAAANLADDQQAPVIYGLP